MCLLDKESPGGAVTPRSATPGNEVLMQRQSTVYRPTEGEDSHPHCCSKGLVFLTYTVHDEEVGEEVERLEVIPCRRCKEEAA